MKTWKMSNGEVTNSLLEAKGDAIENFATSQNMSFLEVQDACARDPFGIIGAAIKDELRLMEI